MKKRKWLLFLLIIAVFPVISVSRCEQQVLKEISRLHSQDTITIRKAIRSLANLTWASNIFLAVPSLQDIVEDPNERFDRYTRSLAAETLAKIAQRYGSPRGERILSPVLRLMALDQSDFIRASCAHALATSTLPSMIQPLEDIYLHDPSPLLREVAYQSLARLTNGAYFHQSVTLSSQTGPGFSSYGTGGRILGRNLSLENCLSDQDYFWIKSHLIILDPRLDLESWRCNALEENDGQ